MTERMRGAVGQIVMGVVVGGCLLVAGCGSSQPAATAPPPQESVDMNVTKAVLERHMKTFGSQDMEGVMADYAPDAVMFSVGGPVKGSAALRSTFQQLFAEWGKPGVKFELKQQTVEGQSAVIYWNAETADNIYEAGMDAFVIQQGKIVAHFFSGKITPKAAPKGK